MNPIRDYKAQLRLFAFFARTAGNGTPEMRKRGGDSEEPCPNLLERDSALPMVPTPPVPPSAWSPSQPGPPMATHPRRLCPARPPGGVLRWGVCGGGLGVGWGRGMQPGAAWGSHSPSPRTAVPPVWRGEVRKGGGIFSPGLAY